MDGPENPGDRRQRIDRREGSAADRGTGEGRRGGPKSTSAFLYVLQAIGAIIVLMLVIVFAVRNTHPVYATKGTLGEELRKHAPGAAAAIGAYDSTNVDRLMATSKFQEEKRNFYEDVMRLKQVDSARADSIAQYAVREAYVRGISPAIIFGVMLTENSRFVSKAQSNVGAVGLMQVYPKVWLTKEMTKLFGRDLASDSTNVKYGVFILSHYFSPTLKGGGTGSIDWATALLHYNGCVHGTNTPRCHTYPNKVQTFVEKQATSICSGRSFYDCIAKPFINGLFKGGKLAPDDSSTRAVVASAASVAADSTPHGESVEVAGDVAGAVSGPILMPPVVVVRPDSAASEPSVPVAAAAPAVPVSVPASTGKVKPAKHAAVAKPAPVKSAPARKPTAKKTVARKSAPSRPAPHKTTPRKKAAAVPQPPKPIIIKLP